MVTLRALLLAVIALFAAPLATAAPATPVDLSVSPTLLPVATNCDVVRAFCRGRFGVGPDFRACVRVRGCAPPVSRRIGYCQQQVRVCGSRWPVGSPPFRRCMFSRGC